MSADIQQARDVLTEWRAQNPLAAWEVRPWVGGFDFAASDAPAVDLGGTRHDHTARLIVGTAGNPDLLDTIDELLAMAIRLAPGAFSGASQVNRLAAAIIAADERMNA